MTQEKYQEVTYKGKHEKKPYKVWRVLSAVGPEQTLIIVGRQEAINMVSGCWDWSVTDIETGKEVY